MKHIGKRSAGNPHAAFEEAGAGNVFGARQPLTLQKLAQGQFVYRAGDGNKQTLSLSELRCLIDGIEVGNARRYKRFTLPASA